MNIKKGDILYRYDWQDRSDKDYCTEELSNFDCDSPDPNVKDCINYKKCYMRPKKIVLTKVTFTKRSFWKYGIEKRIKHYNAVNLKNWREPIGNFNNTRHYKTTVIIQPNDLDTWAKSEKGAHVKVKKSLKEYIKKIKKAEESWYQTDKRNIKNFIALLEKL